MMLFFTRKPFPALCQSNKGYAGNRNWSGIERGLGCSSNRILSAQVSHLGVSHSHPGFLLNGVLLSAMVSLSLAINVSKRFSSALWKFRA